MFSKNTEGEGSNLSSHTRSYPSCLTSSSLLVRMCLRNLRVNPEGVVCLSLHCNKTFSVKIPINIWCMLLTTRKRLLLLHYANTISWVQHSNDLTGHIQLCATWHHFPSTREPSRSPQIRLFHCYSLAWTYKSAKKKN